jgi:tetratricopeptide (TPR) repeat protein
MDAERLLERWLSHRRRCEGTVAWESRLAFAYVMAGRPEEARRVLAPLVGRASQNEYLVDLATLQFDYVGLLRGEVSKDGILRVEEQFQAYVRKYPHGTDGYGQLGVIQTILGKHGEAVASLTAALKSPMNMTGVYWGLTISYSKLGRYSEAMEAADEAVDLLPELLNDPSFVYAAARAFAAGGKVDAARNSLKVLATKRPEVRGDPEFLDVVRFVMGKKAASRG